MLEKLVSNFKKNSWITFLHENKSQIEKRIKYKKKKKEKRDYIRTR